MLYRVLAGYALVLSLLIHAPPLIAANVALGIDVGFDFASFENDRGDTKRETTTFDLPTTQFRLGFLLNDYVLVQPAFGFSAAVYQGAVVNWSTDVGVVGNFSILPRDKVSPFFETGVRAEFRSNREFRDPYSGERFDGDGERVGIPLEFGVRIPIGGASAIRAQSGFIYWINQDTTFWSVPLRFGASLVFN